MLGLDGSMEEPSYVMTIIFPITSPADHGFGMPGPTDRVAEVQGGRAGTPSAAGRVGRSGGTRSGGTGDADRWTYLSPRPVHFATGECTGRYRTGLDQPVLVRSPTRRTIPGRGERLSTRRHRLECAAACNVDFPNTR